MVREGFLEETADFIYPELSLCLRVLAKASLSQMNCHKGEPRNLECCFSQDLGK